MTLACAGIWVVLAATFAAIWLTEEPRVLGLVMLPAVAVASLFVLYREWHGAARQSSDARRDGREIERGAL
jgi:hypothetical protein